MENPGYALQLRPLVRVVLRGINHLLREKRARSSTALALERFSLAQEMPVTVEITEVSGGARSGRRVFLPQRLWLGIIITACWQLRW